MNAIARFIVRCYPAAWRERYEDEVLELLGAGRVRLADVCGLLRHCITERVLALYEPGRHISAYRFISGMALLAYIAVMFLAVIVVGAFPFAAGFGVQRLVGPFPADWVDTLAWLALPVFLLTLVVGWVRLFRLQSGRQAATPLPPEATRLRWMVIGGYAGLMFFVGLEAGLEAEVSFRRLYHHFLQSWVVVYLLWVLPEDFDDLRWPGRGLFETLGRLRSARYDLRWARMELDRCEGLYAGRDPGPELRAARVEMERLLAAEQTALSELDAMGYHARFQS
jgi:hypothetical protein